MSYLTDNEAHVNTAQLGEVKIDLVEQHWDTVDSNRDGIPDAAEDILPNMEVAKDPKVVNTGINDAIIFLRLTVPVSDVTRTSDVGAMIRKDGSTTPVTSGASSYFHEPQELFYFKNASDAITTHANHFNDGWIRLNRDTGNQNTDTDINGVWKYDTKAGTALYVFGWKDAVVPNAETGTLFDKIQLKSIVENEIAGTAVQNIKLEAFAIQADNLIRNGAQFTKKANYTREELEEIYDVFVNQNGLADVSTGTTAAYEFEWNKNQGDGHGQSAKEAQTENKRDLHNGNIPQP